MSQLADVNIQSHVIGMFTLYSILLGAFDPYFGYIIRYNIIYFKVTPHRFFCI